MPASVKAFLARIGEQLKSARESQGLSREDVCRNLKMHIHSLIALEEGIYEDLPGAAYFFASLRSYSRFLKLDADKIINECKRNKFLYEGLQGDGTIQRKDALQEFNEPDIVRHSPSSLNRLNVDNTERRTLELDEPAYKEDLIRSGGASIVSRLASFLAGLLLSALIVSALVYFWMNSRLLEGQFKEELRSKLNFLQISALTKKTCKKFKLVAAQKVQVKITALSIGQTILDRELDAAEELEFSDTEGIKLEVAEPSNLQFLYNDKELDWQNIKDKKEMNTYAYCCR
jgi:transcriptional regulator with XRE-family HTH domain